MKLEFNMSLFRRRGLVAFACLVVVGMVGAGLVSLRPDTVPRSPPTPVSLQLNWTHSSNFAGFYAAAQNDDYAGAGLSVSYMTGGPGVDPFEPVVDGNAQFGIANGNLLVHARAAGKPVRAIACLYRRSPLIYAVLAESGISHPRQFAGKTIRSANQNVPVLTAMTARFGVDPDQLSVVITRDRERFISGEIDVWSGFITGETGWIVALGDKVDLLHHDNFGVHLYYQCIFTTDALIASAPDVVGRFLKASLKGWQRMADNPDEAGALTALYAPDADQAKEVERLRIARPLIVTGEDFIGWMRPEVWEGTVATLRGQNLLSGPVEATDLYTMRFLNEIYGESGSALRPEPLIPVTLQLDWRHSSSFAGFYAADRNGDYTRENLAVSMIAATSRADRIAPVVEGEAFIGLARASEIIAARAKGQPVRAVACVYRRRPFVFGSMAGSGITSPRQFDGKTVGMAKRHELTLDAMLAYLGLETVQYTIEDTTDLDKLRSGEIDIIGGYITGFARLARESGLELNLIHPDDYGVHDYEKCLFTTDETIAADPALVERFLRATLRGWAYAVEHPATAAEMTAVYRPDVAVSDEIARLTSALPLINTGEDHIGWMNPEIWVSITKSLNQMGLLDRAVDPEEVYTMRFLEAVYGTAAR